ncbi:MAG: succinylglutamate desuccinylase/aspartoacylase family protein [Opitutales bacterium]|nr:succinylglutamate desuccinylase/aspartoacylase family protein [Opitutales bacterium]
MDPYTRFESTGLAASKGPAVLILAGIHGDECEPIAAALELIKYLRANDLNKGQVTVVPVANPSAFKSSRREGTDGLDMARVFPGRANGSETERQAHEVHGLIAAADYLVDLHTGGTAMRLAPFSGFFWHTDVGIRERQMEMARVFGLKRIWATDARVEGRSLSSARDCGVPAIYAEMGGGGGFDPDTVAAYLKGCLNVLRWLGIVAGEVEEIQTKQDWIRDEAPESGDLDRLEVSPAEGLFVPSKRVGDVVETGDLIGTVWEIETRREYPVFSNAVGQIFMLRARALVDRNSRLYGIWPLDKFVKLDRGSI